MCIQILLTLTNSKQKNISWFSFPFLFFFNKKELIFRRGNDQMTKTGAHLCSVLPSMSHESRYLMRGHLMTCIRLMTRNLHENTFLGTRHHYSDVIMTVMASQITSLNIVYSTVYSDADQRKHQSSASLAFVMGIHRDLNSPHKWPVTRKIFPFDDAIMWKIRHSFEHSKMSNWWKLALPIWSHSHVTWF